MPSRYCSASILSASRNGAKAASGVSASSFCVNSLAPRLSLAETRLVRLAISDATKALMRARSASLMLKYSRAGR